MGIQIGRGTLSWVRVTDRESRSRGFAIAPKLQIVGRGHSRAPQINSQRSLLLRSELQAVLL